MKYVLMFTNRPDLDAAVPPGATATELHGDVRAGSRSTARHRQPGRGVDPTETATSVKTGDHGRAVVVDGPFSEAKESIGGFTIIDVPDLDAAIAMVKEWPAIGLPGAAVEIRPMVEDYSQFEEQTPATASSELIMA